VALPEYTGVEKARAKTHKRVIHLFIFPTSVVVLLIYKQNVSLLRYNPLPEPFLNLLIFVITISLNHGTNILNLKPR
jgi:hypothetical protein